MVLPGSSTPWQTASTDGRTRRQRCGYSVVVKPAPAPPRAAAAPPAAPAAPAARPQASVLAVRPGPGGGGMGWRTVGPLAPEGLDRVETCGLQGRVDPEDDARCARKADGHHERLGPN